MTWNWAYSFEIMPQLLRGVWVTMIITGASSVLALGGGLLMAILAVTGGRPAAIAVRVVVELLRGVPILVALFFCFYGLPQLGIMLSAYTVGIGVLGLIYAAYCSEVYRGAIQTIPAGMIDASDAIGLTPYMRWTRIIIPLAVQRSIPSLVNYVLLLYRQSALLFAIGLPVLMAEAQIAGYQRFRYLEPYTLAGILYLLLNLPFIYLLYHFRGRNEARSF